MTVIEDILSLSEPANRKHVLAVVLKDHSSAPPIPECTQEEYESALALVRQLGLDLGAVNINWTALEPMRHSRSSGTKHWSSWPRTAVLTMGSLSVTATIPDTVEKIVEEWGSQAPYVLPWKGDSGRLALTYIAAAALSNMVGDTGALTNSGIHTFIHKYIHSFIHTYIHYIHSTAVR